LGREEGIYPRRGGKGGDGEPHDFIIEELSPRRFHDKVQKKRLRKKNFSAISSLSRKGKEMREKEKDFIESQAPRVKQDRNIIRTPSSSGGGKIVGGEKSVIRERG